MPLRIARLCAKVCFHSLPVSWSRTYFRGSADGYIYGKPLNRLLPLQVKALVALQRMGLSPVLVIFIGFLRLRPRI
jgi:hypothetical protein